MERHARDNAHSPRLPAARTWRREIVVVIFELAVRTAADDDGAVDVRLPVIVDLIHF